MEKPNSHPKRILVPVDLSDASHPLLEYALPLARTLQAEVEILFVWEPPRFVSSEVALASAPWTMGDLEGRAKHHARQELADLLLRTEGAAGVKTSTCVEVGAVGPSSLRAAERDGVELIVMGTHGRSGVERWVLGSVAQRVVARAPCPVLTLNPYTPPRAIRPPPGKD